MGNVFNEIIVEHLPKRYEHLDRRGLKPLPQTVLSLTGPLWDTFNSNCQKQEKRNF